MPVGLLSHATAKVLVTRVATTNRRRADISEHSVEKVLFDTCDPTSSPSRLGKRVHRTGSGLWRKPAQ